MPWANQPASASLLIMPPGTNTRLPVDFKQKKLLSKMIPIPDLCFAFPRRSIWCQICLELFHLHHYGLHQLSISSIFAKAHLFGARKGVTSGQSGTESSWLANAPCKSYFRHAVLCADVANQAYKLNMWLDTVHGCCTIWSSKLAGQVSRFPSSKRRPPANRQWKSATTSPQTSQNRFFFHLADHIFARFFSDYSHRFY